VKHNLLLKILVVALIVGLAVVLMIAIIPKNKSNADDSSITAQVMETETNTTPINFSQSNALFLGSVYHFRP